MSEWFLFVCNLVECALNQPTVALLGCVWFLLLSMSCLQTHQCEKDKYTSHLDQNSLSPACWRERGGAKNLCVWDFIFLRTICKICSRSKETGFWLDELVCESELFRVPQLTDALWFVEALSHQDAVLGQRACVFRNVRCKLYWTIKWMFHTSKTLASRKFERNRNHFPALSNAQRSSTTQRLGVNRPVFSH